MTFVEDPNFNKEAIYEDPVWDEIFEEKGVEGIGMAKAKALPHARTSEFLDGISGGFHRASNRHPYYRIENSTPGAISIEFGTAHTKPQRVLRDTIEELESGG